MIVSHLSSFFVNSYRNSVELIVFLTKVRGDALHAMPLLLQYVGTSTLASKQSARLSCLCMIIECRLDLLSIETESRRGVVELESIWSQILSLQSPTLLAYAKEVKAKTILLINSNSDCSFFLFSNGRLFLFTDD